MVTDFHLVEHQHCIKRDLIVMHIGRKFFPPYFCGSYVPWNLENTIYDLVIATPLKLLIHLS